MNFFSWFLGSDNNNEATMLNVDKKLVFVIGKRCCGKTTLIKKLVPEIEPFSPNSKTESDRLWLDNLNPIPWNDPHLRKSVFENESTVIVETQSLHPTPQRVRENIYYLFVFPHISASEINRLFPLVNCVYASIEAFSNALDECGDYQCLCVDLYEKAVTKVLI